MSHTKTKSLQIQQKQANFQRLYSAQNKVLAKLAPMYRDVETTTRDAVPPKALAN